MYINLNNANIPLVLLNGRITKKSFLKWKILPNFSKNIFQSFKLCLTSNKKSMQYLKKLGAKNIKFIGNLKFTQAENEKIYTNKNLKKYILSKKSWCASSTHKTEEKFCGLVHKKLKKRYKNLLTIIIPRHVERVREIKEELEKTNLKVHLHEPNKKISENTDIYVVNSYGMTKSFYNYCKNVFLGGSLVNHGGQNPLEATRYGCSILHGPNTFNFKDIYSFLKKNKISQKITNETQMIYFLNNLLSKKSNSKNIHNKLNIIGQKILDSTYKEVKLTLKNEI